MSDAVWRAKTVLVLGQTDCSKCSLAGGECINETCVCGQGYYQEDGECKLGKTKHFILN